MKLIDFLSRVASFAPTKLIAVLEYIIANVPDLAPQAQTILEGLNKALPVENLIAVAEILPKEIANIAAGKIDPRNHPSDAA